MMRPKEVCEKLGISYTTLRDYVKKGYIRPVITPGNKWRFREEDVERLIGLVKQRKVVLYARVSSNGQKDDMERQIRALEDWARNNNIVNYEVLTDIGSGLNDDRKEFKKILKLVTERKISRIVVVYPDRLTRFGFKILEEICKAHNCEILVLNKEDKTIEQELMEDLISILVSFSEKLQGMKSYNYEKVRKCIEELKA
ncbi:MAG: IS607 family transposase [Caldisphaera sp.]